MISNELAIKIRRSRDEVLVASVEFLQQATRYQMAVNLEKMILDWSVMLKG